MPADLEPRVLEIGKAISSKCGEISRRQFLFSRRYWEEKLLDWIMEREALKIQLLRYIDSFPALKTYHQRVVHLVQYLNDQRVLKDKIPRAFFSLVKVHPFPLDEFYGLATSVGVSFFAHKFIAGTNPQEALKYIRHLKRNRMTCTLDILGEAVLSATEAEEYMHRYIGLLENVGKLLREAGEEFQLNISVKTSSFYSQFKPAAPEKAADKVYPRLQRVLTAARKLNASVTFDVEQYDYRDIMLRIFERTISDPEFKDYPHLGMALQAYLKDALPFTERVLEVAHRRQTPFTIRLVKGAYWDYEIINARQREWEIPVYLQKWQTDANFEQVTRLLFKNYPRIRLALGTHNVRSISYAMAYAQEKGIPKAEIQFQMLFGMGDDIKEAIVAQEYPLRVYAPYGELIPGMAYLVRRILENTSNESFLRQRGAHKVAPEQLLRDPLEHARNEHERSEFIAVPE